VLVYDRVETNRRNTRLLLGLFAAGLFPFVSYVGYFLGGWLGLMLFRILQGMLGEAGFTSIVETSGAAYELLVMLMAFLMALGVVVAATFYQYRTAAPAVLRMTGARPLGPQDEEDLQRTVENLSIGAGLPPPRLYLLECSAPNAFAVGLSPDRASLVVTRGLLRLLDRRELEGVIAHELAHIANYDTRLNTVTAVLATTLRLPVELLRRLFRAETSHGPGCLLQGIVAVCLFWLGLSLLTGTAMVLLPLLDRDQLVWAPPPWTVLTIWVVPLYALLVAPWLGQLLSSVLVQERELLADAEAALLTRNPASLARALMKVAGARAAVRPASPAMARLYLVEPASQGYAARSRGPAHLFIQNRVALLGRMQGDGVLSSVQTAGKAVDRFPVQPLLAGLLAAVVGIALLALQAYWTWMFSQNST
jgi:heat shock protein HtpX